MLKTEQVNVKIDGVPNVYLDQRYLDSTRRTVITQVENVLVNVHVLEDDLGLVDHYAILHIRAGVVNEARSDLLAAYDWAVEKMAEMFEEDNRSAPDRRSRR